MAAALPHKHLALDQHKIDAAKRYWGVASEQEAADKALRPLKGIMKDDDRLWPYP